MELVLFSAFRRVGLQSAHSAHHMPCCETNGDSTLHKATKLGCKKCVPTHVKGTRQRVEGVRGMDIALLAGLWLLGHTICPVLPRPRPCVVVGRKPFPNGG